MSQADVYPNDKNGERVNPPSAESQTSLVNAAEASLAKNSDAGGSQELTIASNTAEGSNAACRSVIIWTDATDVRLKIGLSDASVADFLLLQNMYIPVPVVNPIYLRFYGATNGAKIHILYRN